MNDRESIPVGPHFERIMGALCLIFALLATYFGIARPVLNAIQGKGALFFPDLLALIPMLYVLGTLLLIHGPDFKRSLSIFDKPITPFAVIIVVAFILISVLFAYLPELLIDMLS